MHSQENLHKEQGKQNRTQKEALQGEATSGWVSNLIPQETLRSKGHPYRLYHQLKKLGFPILCQSVLGLGPTQKEVEVKTQGDQLIP